LRSNRRGDEVLTVRVAVPDRLTEKQRKLLEELAETMGADAPVKDTRNFFEKLMDKIGDLLG